MSRASSDRGLKERLDTDRTRASARLGLTLRAVLLAPAQGFSAALKAADRRERAGVRPAEGMAPYVLAAVGGAALVALWLKIGALAGLREICTDRYLVGYIAAALVLGALIGLAAQVLWGAVGPFALRSMDTELRGRDLRLIWGASEFPQVFALAILLPLDLVIVGTDTFTTSKLGDSVSTAWAAFSIALGLSIAVWSLFLFYKGLQTASGAGTARTVGGTVAAMLCLGAVLGVLFAVTVFAPGEASSCPTPRG